MINEPKRRRVTDLAEKLNFLITHPQVVRRHRLSMADLSEACGWSRSGLKSAKDPSRNTLSIRTEVERKLEELCHFGPSWPEWASGSAAAFKERWLAEEASRIDHAHPDNSSQFREGAGGRPNVTIQISTCNITVRRTSEELASLREALSEKTRLDAATEQKIQTLCREVGEARDVIEGIFRRLDPGGDIAENWEQKLLRFADDFRALRTALRALDPRDPGLRALRDQALLAADAGHIECAKALLTRMDAERKPAVANAVAELLSAAEAKAAWGQVARLEFAYKRAAPHFRDASDMLPGKEAKRRREYRENEAWARLWGHVDYIAFEEAKDHLSEMPLGWPGMRAELFATTSTPYLFDR